MTPTHTGFFADSCLLSYKGHMPRSIICKLAVIGAWDSWSLALLNQATASAVSQPCATGTWVTCSLEMDARGPRGHLMVE